MYGNWTAVKFFEGKLERKKEDWDVSIQQLLASLVLTGWFSIKCAYSVVLSDCFQFSHTIDQDFEKKVGQSKGSIYKNYGSNITCQSILALMS